MKKQKKILFVLSGNLSTTPRAIKNIGLAKEKGYGIEVVKVNRASYWNRMDKVLADNLNIKTLSVSPGKANRRLWLKTQVYFFLARIGSHLFKNSRSLLAFSTQKTFIQIQHLLKKLAENYDMIIGQGSGTIYPVFAYAKRKKIPYAIDVEDYYPGENNEPLLKNKTEQLLRIILPGAAYVSYGAPLIRRYSLDLFEEENGKESDLNEIGNDTVFFQGNPHIVLKNSFPSSEFPPPENPPSNSLKLIWFSQNISYDRGLEQIIQAAKNFNNKIELHLIGNLYPSFKKEWIDPNRDFITLLPPMSQEELHKKLSNYDIGLALEPGKDLNNNLALSNKIYAYAQAGLYILATKTAGQEIFMLENDWAGQLCNPTPEDMHMALMDTIRNRNKIRQGKKQRYQKARSLAWENESKKLLKIWEESSKLEAGR